MPYNGAYPGSFLDSPIYRQMMAQTLASSQHGSQYPGEAVANALATALQAYGTKKYGEQIDARDTARTQDYARALSNTLGPKDNSTWNAGPELDWQGQPGQLAISPRVGGNTIVDRLIASGNNDLVSEAAPGIIQQQMNKHRFLSPQEATAAGLQSGGVYQEGPTGEVSTVQAPTKLDFAQPGTTPVNPYTGISPDGAKPVGGGGRYLTTDELKAAGLPEGTSAYTKGDGLPPQILYSPPKPEAPKDPARRAQDNEDAITRAKAQADALNTPYDDETLNFMADQALSGDKSVFAQLGYGSTGQKNRAALRNRITQKATDRGLEGRDLAALNAEFGGLQAAERTLGTRGTQISLASDEAKTFAQQAITASSAVPRGQFVPLSQLMNVARTSISDPKLKQLRIATDALVNARARAISPTGIPRLEDQARGRELMSAADSPEAYAAAVQQFMAEIGGAKSAPANVRTDLRNNFLGGNAAPPQAAPPQPTFGAPGGNGSAAKPDPLGIR